MKNTFFEKARQFLFETKWGLFVCGIVLFYLVTFLVYYFYSPGPEERRQASINAQEVSSQQ